MNTAEINQVKTLCENEIEIAIQRFEQLTGRRVSYVAYIQKKVSEEVKIKSVKIFHKPAN